MEDKTKVGSIIFSAVGVMLIIGLVLYPAFSADTTIFLTNKDGSTPVTCAPNNGFVLAQNMTDLCDVTIISPSTSQLIQYNGTQWVNVNSASVASNATCVNLGSGTILCPNYGNSNINLKSLVASLGIQITNDSDTITFENTGVLSNTAGSGISIDSPTGSNTITNTGVLSNTAGTGISIDSPNGDNTITNTGVITIDAGTGIAVNQTSGNILITNTSPDNTVCANVGTGSQIYKDGECNFRTLGHGTGITLTNNTNDITIVNSLPESTSASNVGTGSGVFKNQTGSILYFKTLVQGTGITVSGGTNSITLTNSLPEVTACTNTGSSLDAIICNGGNVQLKGLKESTGIDIVNNTNDVTIKTKFANGTGISITGSTTQTFTNTGVTSISSDDTSTLSFSASTGAVTASPVLKKLCEVQASGGETVLNCTFSSSTGINQIWITNTLKTTDAATAFNLRFNNDSGSNYSSRTSINGGADSTATSQASITMYPSGTGSLQVFTNIVCTEPDSSYEKSCKYERTSVATGATQAPSRLEGNFKWANTANWITSVNIVRLSGTGNLAQYSYIAVWGYA